MSTAPLRPKRLLHGPGYAMAQLHRGIHARLESELSREGLSLRTYHVLACLEEFGEVSQQQVCDAISVDRGEMVRLVDRLEELGYAARDRDASDRRRHQLTLTPAGRAALARIQKLSDRITDEGLANLSRAERQKLHELTLRALGESLT